MSSSPPQSPSAREGEASPTLDPARELEEADAELRKLGYHYNDKDELRSVDAEAEFVFVNQAHYERLALGVAAYVQALLLTRCGLKRRLVRGVDVYESPDAQTTTGLLVLLCGAGAVAAGQWARRLCINESLTTGSVMPYVEWAKAQGLGVLVLNPNHRDTRSEEHVIAAWDECVVPAAAAHVVMVAHSYGGVCLGSLLDARRDAVTARLRAVALTDSVHGRSVERLPSAQRDFWVAHCVNWVTSREPLDTPVRAAVHMPPKSDAGDTDYSDSEAAASLSDGSDKDDDEDDDAAGAAPLRKRKRSLWAPPWCDSARVSAGHPAHESTSEACRPSACAFLLRKLQDSGWLPPNAAA